MIFRDTQEAIVDEEHLVCGSENQRDQAPPNSTGQSKSVNRTHVLRRLWW